MHLALSNIAYRSGLRHPFDDSFFDDSGSSFSGGWASGSYSTPRHERSTSRGLTNISVAGVEDGFRSADETRPRNMHVIYIIRVW